jgi:hypothetical protein
LPRRTALTLFSDSIAKLASPFKKFGGFCRKMGGKICEKNNNPLFPFFFLWSIIEPLEAAPRSGGVFHPMKRAAAVSPETKNEQEVF